MNNKKELGIEVLGQYNICVVVSGNDIGGQYYISIVIFSSRIKKKKLCTLTWCHGKRYQSQRLIKTIYLSLVHRWIQARIRNLKVRYSLDTLCRYGTFQLTSMDLWRWMEVHQHLRKGNSKNKQKVPGSIPDSNPYCSCHNLLRGGA